MIGDRHPKGFTLFEIVIVLTVFSVALLIVTTIFTNASNSQRREAVSQKALADARVLLNTISQNIHTMTIDYDFYKGRSDYIDGGGMTYRVDCSTFDVATYGDQCDLRSPVHVLALVSDTGESIRYWFNETEQQVWYCISNPGVSSRVCGLTDVDGDTVTDEQYINVTPASVNVSYMDFYITPAADPGYTGATTNCSFDNACACINGTGAFSEEDAGSLLGCNEWTSGYCDVTCQLPDAQPTVTVAMEIQGEGLQVGQVRIPLQFTATSRVYDR